MKKKNLLYLIILFIALLCNMNNAFSQSTMATNTRAAAAWFLGWDNLGLPGDLQIRNDFHLPLNPPQQINFFLNGMIPSGKLDFDLPLGGGANTFFGYQTAPTIAGGIANSFFGVNAGFNNTTAFGNNFYGHSAGFNTADGSYNCMYGDSAGWSNVSGDRNVYMGHVAGFNNILGNGNSYNVFIGDSSGYSTQNANVAIGDGDIPANIYIGASAGFNNISGYHNTYTGFQTGYNNLGTLGLGYGNTYTGYQAAFSDMNGTRNTFDGAFAGYSGGGFDAKIQEQNVFVGYASGYGSVMFGIGGSPMYNAFVGAFSGTSIYNGIDNSFLGYNAGYNTTGSVYAAYGLGNVFLGYESGLQNIDGNYNTFSGYESGHWSDNNYNTFSGYESGYENIADNNTFYGSNSGRNASYLPSGQFNTYIGTNAQYVTPLISPENALQNSAAIGANTIVPYDNQMILGNQNTDVGIGLSGKIASGNNGPQDKLEINLELYPSVGGGNFDEPPTLDANFYSGLKFRDLTSRNTPTDNPSCNSDPLIGSGTCSVLSVDPHGRVILVKESSGGTGIGTCEFPTILPAFTSANGNGAVQMATDQANFYFFGQNTSTPDVTEVGIGQVPSAVGCPWLNGKLDVLQSSSNPGTNGINVLNTDNAVGTPTALADASSIGLRTIDSGSPATTTSGGGVVYPVAGWFESVPSAGAQNYAIVVPRDGGYVSIGYANQTFPYNNPTSRYDLNDNPNPIVNFDVNGSGRFTDMPLYPAATLMVVPDGTGKLCTQPIPAGGGTGTGFGPCDAASGDYPQLTPIGPGEQGIDLNKNNLYFNGVASDNGTIEINSIEIGGYDNCTTVPPRAKLDVERTGGTGGFINPIGLYVNNGDNGPAASTASGITCNVIGVNGGNHGLDINVLNGVGANLGAYIDVSNPSTTSALSEDYAIRLYAHDGQGNTGVRGAVYDGFNTGWTRNAGVEMYVGADNNSTSSSFGGIFSINHGKSVYNHGVWGEVSNNSNASATNVGVYGFTPIVSYLPYWTANTSPYNIAVYGDLGASCTGCLITSNFAGYFNGDVNYTGSLWNVSDTNLKQNIQPLTNPMATLNLLFPKQYEFNQQQNLSMQLPIGTHFGIMAQNLFNVLPQLTKHVNHPARYDSLGNMTYDSIPYLAVNPIELIPFLISASKQFDSTNHAQQNLIDTLIAQNNSLRNSLNSLWSIVDSCCNLKNGDGNRKPKNNGNGENNNGGNGTNNIDVSLGSQSIVLFQNVPNPFKEQTIISYIIPDNLTDVKILFTDNLGNIIKEVPISSHGQGQMTVYAQDLSSGIYMYTIISNGITIDSKKMVKMK